MNWPSDWAPLYVCTAWMQTLHLTLHRNYSITVVLQSILYSPPGGHVGVVTGGSFQQRSDCWAWAPTDWMVLWCRPPCGLQFFTGVVNRKCLQQNRWMSGDVDRSGQWTLTVDPPTPTTSLHHLWHPGPNVIRAGGGTGGVAALLQGWQLPDIPASSLVVNASGCGAQITAWRPHFTLLYISAYSAGRHKDTVLL